MLAKCASLYETNTETKKLYSYLLAATRLPLDNYSYSSINLSNIMESDKALKILDILFDSAHDDDLLKSIRERLSKQLK